MNDKYLQRAKEKIKDPRILSIIASKRARQLARGARPMIKTDDQEHLDVALLEIAEGLVDVESWFNCKYMKTELILGIETSCDETAASVVNKGCEVRSNVVSSQIEKHAPFGGVIPELAAREHLTNIEPVVSAALKEANVTLSEIKAISVTNGPGLLPALLVGFNFAKALSLSNNIPLIGVNHFLAHIYGTFLEFGTDFLQKETTYPIVALVVSGGHTSLVLIDQKREVKLLGGTIDDAAGEAFDKAAKLLSLGYPGGPIIEKVAKLGNPNKYSFPRPLTGTTGKPLSEEDKFNFSFSGIKTSLLYHCKKLNKENDNSDINNLSELKGNLLYDTVASYQKAIIDVLTMKSIQAVKTFNAKSLVLCGGVACNGALRESIKNKIVKTTAEFYVAPPKYCTDNAAMVAGLGYHHYKKLDILKNDSDVFTRINFSQKLYF